MKKESIKKPLLIIGLYFILQIVLVIILNPFIKDTIESQTIFSLIINSIITLIMIIIFKKKLKGDLTSFKKNWKKNLKTMFKVWLIGLGLQMLSNLLITALLTNNIASNEAANREMLTSFPLPAILSMCIISPILEELLFRLNFKDVFKSRKAFILTTGILFGAMHLIASVQGNFNPLELLYIIPYSILGIAFATIFYDTKCITSSILMHAFHNSLSITLILLAI